MNDLLGRVILPAINRCEVCRKSENDHSKCDHRYQRDSRIPEWYGWHAARRGLGSNLYRLGVPDIVIQRILRHANVSTTATYYIKTAAEDVRNAMAKLESTIPSITVPESPCHSRGSDLRDTVRTLNTGSDKTATAVN